MQTLIGEHRRQILKVGTPLHYADRISVYIADIKEGCKLLCRCFHTTVSHNNIACFQIEPTNLRRRHIHVIVTWQEILAADKSKAVRHNLQNSIGLNAAV